MLEYIHVLWRHDQEDTPVELLYEVLPDRSVPRMVEMFADGRCIASALAWERLHAGDGGISLVDGPMSELAEIPDDSEFKPGRITKQAFEAAFHAATPIIEQRKHP